MNSIESSRQAVRVSGRRIVWAAFFAATALTLTIPSARWLATKLAIDVMARAGHPTPPPVDWTRELLRELPVWYGWVLIVPVLFALTRRFPVGGSQRLRNLAIHAAAGVAVICLEVLFLVMVQGTFFPLPLPVTRFEGWVVGLLQYGPLLLIVYASIVGVQHATVFQQVLQLRTVQAARLESRLAHAQLDVLRNQLQPHFLFNTLNTVVALIRTDVRAAEDTVRHLSELLRLSLRNSSTHEVPLREELDFLDEYVAIQRARFADRLRVSVQAPPETLEVFVPRLALQPLVENAIRHGIQRREGPGSIEVRAGLDGGRLTLEVLDDGVGLTGDPFAERDDGGIGVRNTRARLEQLYGTEHEFAIEPRHPAGVRVRLTIPASRSPAAAAVEEP
jgi:two-component system LytT family sensor kinase